MFLSSSFFTGKTSLVTRFVKNHFSSFLEATIGATFLSSTVTVNGLPVKLEIWDTAGTERYHALAPMYYRGASAVIATYDITSYESFEKMKVWVEEVLKAEGTSNVFVIAGCKTDLEDRKVDLASVEEFARTQLSNSLVSCTECSAKTGDNVSLVFETVGKLLVQKSEM
eukprot:TRINITY_DN2693_c0_g1_i2.p1 TRINITY_DN2693_c0_g1~~TRINITY_DN2693_c0_g1_i2.p1  ORF type:complete len:169 (+),score=42.84 TRINITY_DN2693_c0_g1_i2:66-572(+)